ncbi:MAG: methyltransferase domain-containing protein [Nannocystaceae bacterium]
MDLVPDTYARWRATTLGRITERLEVELVDSLAECGPGDRVLDVGTGDGTYAIQAARRGAVVVGLDRSPAMLAAAGQRARAAGVQVELRLGSAEALPFADASFDRVLAVTVLCLVDDPVRALAEMARVTRPGGRIVLGELELRGAVFYPPVPIVARITKGLDPALGRLGCPGAGFLALRAEKPVHPSMSIGRRGPAHY